MWVAATFVAGGIALLIWAVWKRSAQATRDRINAQTAQETAEILNRVERVDAEVAGLDDEELDALVFGPKPTGVSGPPNIHGGPERR